MGGLSALVFPEFRKGGQTAHGTQNGRRDLFNRLLARVGE